ncbi:MAG: hypothetical protein Q9182_002224 [Xanthomendoza sp. 2 TL-2023]
MVDDGVMMTMVQVSKFWDARIEVSGVPQSSTRIPLIPDQTTFIKQWYDWYRGYSVSTNLDGSEERQALIGEALSEVSLGHLPRTTEELQARNTEILNTQTAITQPNVTIASSSRFPTTGSDIDPEDRIFDWSSNSESSEASDNSDNEESPRSAQQQLLLNLQQNIEDIRANVIQLTRRIPQYRDSSQVSTVSRQLNSVTRSLGAVRRHRHTLPQQHPVREAMEDHRSTGGNSHGERHLRGIDSSTPSLTTQEIRLLDDEELQQRIDRIQNRISQTSGVNSLRGGPLRPLDHESYFSLTRLLGQAMQEQERRRLLAGVLGTREEVERQGQNYQSPLASLFARSAPGQIRDQSSVNIDTNYMQPRATPENWGTSNPSTGLPGSVNHSTETDGALDLSPGEGEAISRTLRQTYGHPNHRSGPSRNESSSMERLDGSDPSLSQIEASSAGQSTFSLTRRFRLYGERYDLEHTALSGQSARSSPDFPSNDRNEPRIWRHGASGIMPEVRHRSNVHLLSLPRSAHTAAEHGSAGSTSERRNTHTTTPDFTYGLSSPSFNLGFDERRASNTPLPPYVPMIDLTSPHPPPPPDADRIWSYNTARAVERGTRRQRQRQPQPQASLDNDSTRPEPASKEAMTVFMECKICFAQLSNQAVMPCGE